MNIEDREELAEFFRKYFNSQHISSTSPEGIINFPFHFIFSLEIESFKDADDFILNLSRNYP